MKKGVLAIMSFLILPVLSGCGALSMVEAPWKEVSVPEGNFAVVCPNEQHLDNDEDSSLLLCRGAEADYTVLASDFKGSGDEAANRQEMLDYANTFAQAAYSKIISSDRVERNGRMVQEIVGIEKSNVPEEERGSAYHLLRGEKPLVFQRTFYANKQTYTLTINYDTPSGINGYQQVLDKNKEKRERFFNSFRFLEDRSNSRP